MNIKSVGHIAFHCRDMQKSIAFYKKVFGLTEKFAIHYSELLSDSLKRHPELNPDDVPILKAMKDKGNRIWLCYLEFEDGFFFELFDSPCEDPAPEMKKLTGLQHIAVIVDDIHATYADILKMGIENEGEPRLGPDRTWQFWIHDPDGNQFEFMQYTPESYQVVGNRSEG